MKNSAFWCVGGVIFIAALLLVKNSIFPPVEIPKVSYENAKIALSYIKEVTIWMAGIQAGVLVFLGVIAKDHPERFHFISGPCTVVLMGAALFCEAWVLTGLPSIAMRLPSNVSTGIDVLSQPIYSWFCSLFSFEYFITLQHWYWVVGILFFSHVLITIINYKNIEKEEQK